MYPRPGGRAMAAAALFTLAAWSAGCGVSIHVGGGRGHDCPPPCPGPSTPTTAEIEAIGQLTFENERQERLLRVARRPDLSGFEQVYLLDAASRQVSFDSRREAVVLALIDNPAFSPAARRHILERLSDFSFESSKSNILDAIDRRGAVAPPPAPPAE